MSKIDTEAKAYLNSDERFSDLFNFGYMTAKTSFSHNKVKMNFFLDSARMTT